MGCDYLPNAKGAPGEGPGYFEEALLQGEMSAYRNKTLISAYYNVDPRRAQCTPETTVRDSPLPQVTA